jgi:hypothetical protein
MKNNLLGLDLQRFNAVEVQGVKVLPLSGGNMTFEMVSDKEDPDMYSVYLRYNPELPENEEFGGVECVADFKDKEDAIILADALEILIGN